MHEKGYWTVCLDKGAPPHRSGSEIQWADHILSLRLQVPCFSSMRMALSDKISLPYIGHILRLMSRIVAALDQ